MNDQKKAPICQGSFEGICAAYADLEAENKRAQEALRKIYALEPMHKDLDSMSRSAIRGLVVLMGRVAWNALDKMGER